MTRQFNVVVERDAEGFFVATVPGLPGCHTQARSLDQLMERVRAAIELWLDVEGEPAGLPWPRLLEIFGFRTPHLVCPPAKVLSASQGLPPGAPTPITMLPAQGQPARESFTDWREFDGCFLDYLNAYPDHWTQGDNLEDLKSQLLDLYQEFSKGDLPGIRKVGELVVA